MISITRIDPLGGIPDPTQRGTILSVDQCSTWDDVIKTIAHHGITQFSAAQLRDFSAEQPGDTITFKHGEFLNLGVAAYMCNVNYTIAEA